MAKFAVPILLVLVIIGIAVAGSSSKGAKKAAGNAHTSAVTTTAPPEQSVNPASPSATSSSAHSQTTGVTIDPALEQQVSTIVSSFYYWGPDMSVQERLQRLPAFTLNPSQLQLYVPVPAYVAMARRHTLHTLATVVDTMGAPVPGERSQFTVSGTAYLRFVNADASVYVENGVVYQSKQVFHTQWQKRSNGMWYLMRFIDGGDTK